MPSYRPSTAAFRVALFAILSFVAWWPHPIAAQSSNLTIRIIKSGPSVTVSWTNRGTLQAASTPAGA